MTKTQAREVLRQRMVTEVGLLRDGKVTLRWFVETRWKPLRQSSWRDSSVPAIQDRLEHIYKRFGDTPIEELDAVELQLWLDALAKERSGWTVKLVRTYLRSICSEAVEQDYLRKSPARLLRVPRMLKPSAKGCLTLEQVAALLEAARLVVEDTLILKTFLLTGMRPSELFCARWKSFNQDMSCLTLTETIYRGVIRPFTKTTEQGDDTENVLVVIPQRLGNELAEWSYKTKYGGLNDFIFCNTEGGFVQKQNWQQRVLTPLANRAGIERCNFQMLRRTVATHSAKLGSVRDAASILRHKGTQTVQKHYIQTIDASVRQVAESMAERLLGLNL